MIKKIEVPETRGRKRKHDFEGFKLGETRTAENTTTGSLLASAKQWAAKEGNNFKFRCYTVDGTTHIVRIK